MRTNRLKSILASILAAGILLTAPAVVPKTVSGEPTQNPADSNIAPQSNYVFSHHDATYPDYDPFANESWYKPDVSGKELTDGQYANPSDYEAENWVGVSAYLSGTAVSTVEFTFKQSVAISSIVTSCYPLASEYGIAPPVQVTVSLSEDGVNWKTVAVSTDSEIMMNLPLGKRYIASHVRVDYLHAGGWLLLDEVEILGSMDVTGAETPAYFDVLSAGKTYTFTAEDTANNAVNETFLSNGWYKEDTAGKELTDGVFGNGEDYSDAPWAGFSGWSGSTVSTFTVDLGSRQSVSRIDTSFFPKAVDGIGIPGSVRLLLSYDGKAWMDMGTVQEETEKKQFLLSKPYQARYVQLQYRHDAGWLIIDEVQVLGSSDPAGAAELDVNPAVNLAEGKTYTLTAADQNGTITTPGYEGVGEDSNGKKLTDAHSAVSNDRKDNAWVGYYGWITEEIHNQVTGTVLQTGTTTTTFEMDLGEVCGVEEIHTGFCSDAEIMPPARMTLWLSLDGINWTKQADFTDNAGMSTFQLGAAYKARYLRIDYLHTGRWLLLDEIQVLGRKNCEMAKDPESCDKPFVPSKPIELPRNTEPTEERFPENGTPEHLEGYQKPGQSTNDIQDLVLLYNQYYKEGTGDYTAEKILPYLIYQDREGNTVDTMFDGVLFLALFTNRWNGNNGTETWRSFSSNGAPAEKIDYEWYLKKTFRAGGDMDALQEAAEKASQLLKDPDYKVKTVLMVPVPGNDLGMGSKAAAMDWYMNEILTLFRSGSYNRVELSGLYLLEESISSGNENIQHIVNFAKDNGLKTYWIPYYRAGGVAESAWKDYGIDAVAYQPNSYFYEVNSGERLRNAAREASQKNMGIEIENGPELLTSWESFEKALDYLDASVLYNFQGQNAFRAYYQWVVGYERYCDPSKENPDFIIGTPAYERGRQIYEATYQMMKGTLKLSNRSVLPAPQVELVQSTTVTLKSQEGCEYSVDGIHWQTSGVFSGLNPQTRYFFRQRMAETDTHSATMPSPATEVFTEKDLPAQSSVSSNGGSSGKLEGMESTPSQIVAQPQTGSAQVLWITLLTMVSAVCCLLITGKQLKKRKIYENNGK